MADQPRSVANGDRPIALTVARPFVSEPLTPYGHVCFDCGEAPREIEVCASVPYQFTINGRSHVGQANVFHKIRASTFEVVSLLGLGGSVEVRLLPERLAEAVVEDETTHTAQLDDSAKAA